MTVPDFLKLPWQRGLAVAAPARAGLVAKKSGWMQTSIGAIYLDGNGNAFIQTQGKWGRAVFTPRAQPALAFPGLGLVFSAKAPTGTEGCQWGCAYFCWEDEATRQSICRTECAWLC